MKSSERVLFIGSKELGLRCLQQMYSLGPKYIAGILTTDDRDDRRSVLKDFEEFAVSKRIDFNIAADNKEIGKVIKKISPDICFVVGWYRIIDRKTLDLVPNGFLGVHHSLLPRYRGGSPLVWAMINGDKIVGTTLFSFAEGMDDGDIWAQEKIEIGEDDYISDVMARLEKKAVSILRDKYVSILEGKITPVSQEQEKATYCAQRIPEDGLINWEKSAEEVYNFIKAQSEPYPGAFTFFNDNKLTIWRAHPDDRIYFGTPGQVAERSGDMVCVVCGDSRSIILETVEYDGVKSPAGHVIKSIKTRFKSR